MSKKSPSEDTTEKVTIRQISGMYAVITMAIGVAGSSDIGMAIGQKMHSYCRIIYRALARDLGIKFKEVSNLPDATVLGKLAMVKYKEMLAWMATFKDVPEPRGTLTGLTLREMLASGSVASG